MCLFTIIIICFYLKSAFLSGSAETNIFLLPKPGVSSVLFSSASPAERYGSHQIDFSAICGHQPPLFEIDESTVGTGHSRTVNFQEILICSLLNKHLFKASCLGHTCFSATPQSFNLLCHQPNFYVLDTSPR